MLFSLTLLSGFALVNAVSIPLPAGPSVAIKNGTVVGSTSYGVDSFIGIPFAQPPLGNLRLRPPQPITEYLGTINATGSEARACPQFQTSDNSENAVTDLLGTVQALPIYQRIMDDGEDCLTLNVLRPANTLPGSKLPVVFWIYGGAFEFGGTSANDGTDLVQKSVDLLTPMIYVAVNYRLGGFGFLAGQELSDEGSTNLGLKDQRAGMHWVQENIAAFGGDPSKVTIWGQSAGAISVFDHLLINGGDNTYNGEPLFRAAIMNSGSMIPTESVTTPKAQVVFDYVVEHANCYDAADVLACLRAAPYTELLNAMNSVPGIVGYHSVDLSYLPRPDPHDNFFALSPEVSLDNLAFSRVPIMIGDQEDEGTFFSTYQANITTNQDVLDYLAAFFPTNPNASTMVNDLIDTYPNQPLVGQPLGSPFDSGSLYSDRPQYKRLSAILGDFVFILQRRYILKIMSTVMPSWSYLSSVLHLTTALGTYHGAELDYIYGNGNTDAKGLLGVDYTDTLQRYYISFITQLDPNALGTPGEMIEWPQYNFDTTPFLMNFLNGSNQIIPDDFRIDSYNFLAANEEGLRV